MIVNDQEEAEQRTREAQETLKSIEEILIYTLEVDDTVDWEKLKPPVFVP